MINPLEKKINERTVILGSASPRRKDLLSGLGLKFIVASKETDETFPSGMDSSEVAEFLSRKKSEMYDIEAAEGSLIITADTVVRLNDEVINKPSDFEDAFSMLEKLSGKDHIVTTGVCLRWDEKRISFSDHTRVSFSVLSADEINFYLENNKPYDKAGSYGIQDWIGFAFIDRIEGSYHNVMGLPTAKLYSVLKEIDL